MSLGLWETMGTCMWVREPGSEDGCGCDCLTMGVCTYVCETRDGVHVCVWYTLSSFLNIILERNPATTLHLWLPLQTPDPALTLQPRLRPSALKDD